MAMDESPLSIYRWNGPARPLKRPTAQIIAVPRPVGKYPSLTTAYAKHAPHWQNDIDVIS
jgi:hypothetical protein